MLTVLAALLAAASAALAVQPFGRPPPSGGQARVARQVPRPALAVGGLLVLAAVAGPVGAVVGAVGLALLTRARRRSAADREARLRRSGAAELLRALAAELESGLDPPSAVAAAAAAADQRLRTLLDPVVLAAAHGGDVADALVRTGVPRLRELAACWLACRASGAALAPVVDRLARVAEGDEAHHAEIRAALAGPRASGRLLAGLPLAGLGLSAVLGGSPLGFLLHTGPGAACLVVGLGLDLAGLAWLERLAARATRPTR